jgi:hypothetical protein
VVVETEPGRIEAVILAGSAGELDEAARKTAVDAAVRSANGVLGPNQRIAGWRLWPDEDFPRTHTLKVRRDPVRDWATSKDGAGHGVAVGAAAAAGARVSSGR